ncbi:sodium-independent organic anion transmembrane transporter [Mactra antiquata]
MKINQSSTSRGQLSVCRDKLLAKIDDKDTEQCSTPVTKPFKTSSKSLTADEDECVICMSAKATMQTFPCGHKVICRKCFIKTIQVAVSQRCLPLKCVICRTRILKLRQATAVKMTTAKIPRPKSSRFSKQSKVYAK